MGGILCCGGVGDGRHFRCQGCGLGPWSMVLSVGIEPRERLGGVCIAVRLDAGRSL